MAERLGVGGVQRCYCNRATYADATLPSVCWLWAAAPSAFAAAVRVDVPTVKRNDTYVDPSYLMIVDNVSLLMCLAMGGISNGWCIFALSSCDTVAQQVVGAFGVVTAAGVAYYLVVHNNGQQQQEKQQKEIEIERGAKRYKHRSGCMYVH